MYCVNSVHRTIPGHEHSYTLDGGHKLITGKPLLVCGNTAAMLQESWLKSHFEVQGDRSVHYGIFPGCGDAATGSGQESGDVCCGVDRGGAAASTFQPSGCC